MGKSFRLFGMALMGIFLCASCSSENDKNEPSVPKDPIEDFEQGDMNFTEKAGEQSFTFTANVDWNLSVASTSNGASWCTVSPSKGSAGTQTIKVNVSENDTYDNRSVTITLKAGTESKYFVVTQKQKDAILLTSDKFEVNQQGGTIHVEVKANVEYTAEIGETCKDWIKEAPNTRGLNTTTKAYTIAANEDSEKREGSIVFSDGTQTEIVHVYQAGGDIILLTQNEYYADAAGEDITVELKSNCEYEVEMPDVDWVHEIQTRGMSSHTLYYTIDANESYDSREAKIVYRNKTKETADTLTITQAQKDAIILGQKEITVKSEGETIEVKLSANVNYEVEMPDVDWITTKTTRGLTEYTLYYEVAKNEEDDSRSAKITFVNKNSELEEVLTITQEGNRKIVTIDVPVAGNLSNITQRTDFKALKLTGRLNAKDIQTIRRMRYLEYLDISEVDIIGGSTYYYQDSYNISIFLEDNTIGERMFTNGENASLSVFENLKEVLLPNSVTKIDQFAFERVHSLCKVKLPDKLKTIEGGAFYKCSNITNITIPNGVTTIGHTTFGHCKNLYSISIPNSVTTIENSVFWHCEKLTDISLPSNLTKIGDNTFSNCSSLKNIEIHEGVTSIGNTAFASCKSLENVSIPTSVTEIGDGAFFNCESLTGITLPNGVKTIGANAFSGCPMMHVTIPQSITEIKERAFDKLSEVRIFCTTPPSGYIECDKLYIPKGTYQKYFLSKWGEYATNIIEMEE